MRQRPLASASGPGTLPSIGCPSFKKASMKKQPTQTATRVTLFADVPDQLTEGPRARGNVPGQQAITRFDDTVLPRFGVPATLPG